MDDENVAVLKKHIRDLQEGMARQRAALETQDLLMIQTLRLACRVPQVQKVYRDLLDQMMQGMRRGEKANDGIPEYLKEAMIDAGLAHVAMYREAVENPVR